MLKSAKNWLKTGMILKASNYLQLKSEIQESFPLIKHKQQFQPQQ